ncbi:MAG: FkbM family methyltransferase, partial [bacterium]
MKTMYYFLDHDRIATLYVEFWRQNGRTARLFPFIENERDHYLGRYVLPCEFHRHLLPFQFLNQGDRIVHVGFHDQYIHAGVSHPLIMAAIVGETGHVWAIDPDPTNTETLDEYKKTNGIENVSIIQIGVWKEKGVQEFVFFDDYTSSNTISSIFEGYRDGVNKRWGQSRVDTKSAVQRVEVDTLDSIIGRKAPDLKIDFLNMTVNGAEEQVL